MEAQDVLCMVCLERAPVLACQNGHIICGECLEGYVNNVATNGEIGAAEARNGRMPCFHSGQGCDDLYSHRTLALALSEETFQCHQAAIERMMEARIVAAQQQQGTQEAEDEFQRHRAYILDSILTFKCEHCGSAWESFDGCVAVRCQRCRHAFCGMCTKDCGADAHPHVLRGCPLNARGELWPSLNARKAANNVVRTRRLTVYLQQFSPEYRERLMRSLEVDLGELGMDATDTDATVEMQHQHAVELAVFAWKAKILVCVTAGLGLIASESWHLN